MKVTLICDPAHRREMLSDLYFRNHLANHVHIRTEAGMGDTLRVVMYVPMDQMPEDLISWINAQPAAVRVFITA